MFGQIVTGFCFMVVLLVLAAGSAEKQTVVSERWEYRLPFTPPLT
jgi:hypothetical protein